MGAVDLLFDVKRESERLHQIALGSLLLRTPLLGALGIQPAVDRGSAPIWEPPLGKSDLALRLTGGSQLYVELKLDSVLGTAQLAAQMAALAAQGGPADRLLYLLVGYAAVAVTDRKLAEAADAAGLPRERVIARRGADLLAALTAMAALPAHGPDGDADRDARDLAVSYREHVARLALRVSGFSHKPPQDWTQGDFFGFFDRCRRERLGSMEHAGIAYVPNPSGGFVGCYWCWQPVAPGVRVYLQFESWQLCVKIEVEQPEQRSRARDRACAALLALPAPEPLRLRRPVRLGHGQYMTIGYLDGVPGFEPARAAELAAAVTGAEALLSALSARLRGA
jgi:hypothetical protein